MAEKDFKVKNGLVVNDSATFNSVVTVTGNVNVTGTISGTFEGTTTGFDSDFASKTTADLTEGSNLYYTTARADSDAKHAISLTDAGGDGSMTYSSDTGVITYTGPSASEVRAHFSAGTGVTITDGEVIIGQDVGTTDNVTFAKITGDSAALDNIKFNSRATAPSSTFGTLYYDSDEQKGPSITLRTLENTSPGVTVNVGQEILVYVHNLTGQQINNGEAVYISGTAHGKHPQVSLAKADASSTGRTAGLATMNIPNGAHGWVTTFGIVRDLNTSAYTAGDVLYLSADSAGQLTNVSVSVDDGYPEHVARVLRVDSSTGMVLVERYAEHFEYLRIEDRLKVSGKIEADSGNFKILNLNTTAYTDVDVPNNLPASPPNEGDLFYFQGPDALTYSNSEINVKIGQDQVIRVYNNSGTDIPKGKVVYVTGAANDFPTIALAKADAFNTVYNTIGLSAHTIANGSFGFVFYSGLFGGLDTSQFNVGEFLHVSPDSAGELVNFSPDFPNWPVQVGAVLVSDSANGGNVGGCIQVHLTQEIAENIRTQGNIRVDGNMTVAGNLNILGSETITTVQNLNVSNNFIYIGAGDTVSTTFNGAGLNDATFKEYYEGDSDLTYNVEIIATDSAGAGGDTIKWYFSGDSTGLGFDSAGGPTTWQLGTDGISLIPLRYNVKITFETATGHTSGDRWSGLGSPTNVDLGIVGNYNTPTEPYSHAGFFRDANDEKFKVFNRYDPEVQGNINTSDSSFELGTMVASTFEGNLTGNVTGNASTATLLQTPRTIAISGDVTGTATSFNGGSNISISSQITAGSIVNADINAAAAIADTKLATISTAGKVQNSATTATDANTGSTIVTRDVSGDFSAGLITADFNRSAHTTVAAGTYGSASLVPVLTVDASGFIDSIGSVSVAGVASLEFDSATHAFTINTADGGSFAKVVQTKMPGSSGTFGSASLVPVITVNDFGLVDSISTVSVAGVSTFDFDSATGQITIGTADGGSFSQVITLDPYTTTNLTEGTNEYFTQARARGSISVTDAGGDGSLGYNSGTGVITYTGPSASETRAHFSGGTGITYNSGTGAITTTDAEIVHDNLSGFVANEHIDHTSVTITAGSGLTGGGTIAATRTLNIGQGTGITVSADAIATNDAEIVHDNLSGFVADEHIAHSGVSITAGSGLTGGGTIAATRTLNIGEGTGITVTADAIATNDAEIVHDNLSGFVADEHVAHTGVSIVAGSGLTGGGNIASSRTLNVIGSAGINANADNITIDSAHVKSLFSASGDLSYNSGTGAFSFNETYSSASELLTAIKTVDGTGSGLDADTLDGQQGSYYRIDVYDASGTLLN